MLMICSIQDGHGNAASLIRSSCAACCMHILIPGLSIIATLSGLCSAWNCGFKFTWINRAFRLGREHQSRYQAVVSAKARDHFGNGGNPRKSPLYLYVLGEKEEGYVWHLWDI